MAAVRVFDDRRKVLYFPGPAKRIVSLVPSDTFNLFYLGAGDRIVGRTRYCVEPAPEVHSIAEVGGTKDADIQKIVDLAPDVVIANQEENSRTDIEKLEAAGLVVYLSFPKRVAEGLAHLARLSKLLGFDTDKIAGARAKKALGELYQILRAAQEKREKQGTLRVFMPIWADPLMTANGDAFLSDALDLAGGTNVFFDRERRYPLAADLGMAATFPSYRTEGKDTRYPRITLEEVERARPEVILLPDEPHPFSQADAERFKVLDIPAAKVSAVYFCDGKDAMWYGARCILGLGRLTSVIDSARALY
ncbi:MAG: ABC transporter substrate-binding protein [Polyangiaceae bacterium]|nr:ABC transporter substrate-binding protein [Polyangiaceae bacterium]